jgi:hypothetical protein
MTDDRANKDDYVGQRKGFRSRSASQCDLFRGKENGHFSRMTKLFF